MTSPRGYGFGREGVDAALEAADEPSLNDEEWDLVGDLTTDLNGEGDYAFAAEKILKVRRSQSGRAPQRKAAAFEMQPVEVPEHWRHQCMRLFNAYAEEAAVARLILGVESPLPVDGLGDYLAAVASRERQEGDLERLGYLDPLGNAKQIGLRRGYSGEELRAAVNRGELKPYPAPRPLRTSEREWQAHPQAQPGRNLTIDWIAPRQNHLCRIADLSRRIAKQTGCHPAEATMFLLCDVVPELPWLEARVFDFDSGRRHAFTIHIGSPLVPAEDVRRFYLQVREQSSQPSGGGQTKRGRSRWTYELLSFVEEHRKASYSWQTILEEWNNLFPDHPYKNVPGIQRSYYQARGRAPKDEEATITFVPRVFRSRGAR
jgi:hypothetical protein